MKIFLLINTLKFGGAERQVVNDSLLLAEEGVEVAILYYEPGELVKAVGNNKVRLIQLSGTTFPARVWSIYQILKKEKPNYLFAHMFWAQKASPLPTLLTNTRLIFFEHGLGLWKRWYHILITKLASRFAEKIITVSRAKKKIKIEREGFSAKKIRVIPNSFNPANDSQNKVDRQNNVYIIGFAGRFNAVKQLDLLIDVAIILREKIDEFCFCLLGDGNTRKYLEEMVRKNDLEKYFELPGYVSNIQEHLKDFDAFVLPSKREDLSVALLEASAAGLPCVAFDVGGNKEIILDNKTGFIIKPFDVKRFAEKLILLRENDQLRQEMSKEAQEYINKEFSKGRRLEKIKEIINL